MALGTADEAVKDAYPILGIIGLIILVIWILLLKCRNVFFDADKIYVHTYFKNKLVSSISLEKITHIGFLIFCIRITYTDIKQKKRNLYTIPDRKTIDEELGFSGSPGYKFFYGKPNNRISMLKKLIDKKKLYLPLFLIFFSRVYSQEVDIKNDFGGILINYEQAFSQNNPAEYLTCLHPVYSLPQQKDSINLLMQFFGRNHLNPVMEVNRAWKESDFFSLNGNDYIRLRCDIKVYYTFSKNAKLTEPKINKIFNALFHTTFVKSDIDSIYYGYPPKRFILKKQSGTEKWFLLDYDPEHISLSVNAEPLKVFMGIEGVDGKNCEALNFNTNELGEYVFNAFKNNDYKNLYCELGITGPELETSLKFNFSNLPDKKLDEYFYTLVYKRESVMSGIRNVLRPDYYYRDNFSKAKLRRVYSIIKMGEDSIEYSNILVEYSVKGKLKYFEIECARPNKRWLIVDDINPDSIGEEYKKLIGERKLPGVDFAIQMEEQ